MQTDLLFFHLAAAGTSTGGNASFFHSWRASKALKWIWIPEALWISSNELSPNTISGRCVVPSIFSHLQVSWIRQNHYRLRYLHRYTFENAHVRSKHLGVNSLFQGKRQNGLHNCKYPPLITAEWHQIFVKGWTWYFPICIAYFMNPSRNGEHVSVTRPNMMMDACKTYNFICFLLRFVFVKSFQPKR